MSRDSHISVLEAKHQELDRRIRTEQGQPGMNDHRINDLKRRKLGLKDEIARLRQAAA